MSLPVIPELKLTDMGLFDVTVFDFISVEAVSYTHLDVYKRQSLYSRTRYMEETPFRDPRGCCGSPYPRYIEETAAFLG